MRWDDLRTSVTAGGRSCGLRELVDGADTALHVPQRQRSHRIPALAWRVQPPACSRSLAPRYPRAKVSPGS